MDKRETTWEVIRQIDVQDFDGQIEDVIDLLGSIRAIAYSKGYLRVRIDLHQSYENVEYYLRGERYLTAEEIAKKIELEELTKKVKLDRERAQYEELKKKFEG